VRLESDHTRLAIWAVRSGYWERYKHGEHLALARFEIHIQVGHAARLIPGDMLQQFAWRGEIDPQPASAAGAVKGRSHGQCLTCAEMQLVAVWMRAARGRHGSATDAGGQAAVGMSPFASGLPQLGGSLDGRRQLADRVSRVFEMILQKSDPQRPLPGQLPESAHRGLGTGNRASIGALPIKQRFVRPLAAQFRSKDAVWSAARLGCGAQTRVPTARVTWTRARRGSPRKTGGLLVSDPRAPGRELRITPLRAG
jgi:hypothetical protein